MRVFIAGGVSFNNIVRLNQFPQPIAQTIHECEYSEALGSTGSGKAVNMAKLGFDVDLHAMLGDDDWGKKAIEALAMPKLNFFYDIDPKGTERHINILDKKGQRISIFTNTVTDHPDINYNQFRPYISKADFVVVNLSNYSKNILPLVKALNKPIWTDLHDYDGQSTWHKEYIDYSDYILFSSDNFKNYKTFMKEMILKGKKLVVVTHGRKGSEALTRAGEWLKVEAIPNIKLVDCNGAGDGYFSGFLYGFSQGLTIKKCMQYGAIVGALCVQSEMLYHPILAPDFIESKWQEYFGA